MPEAGGLRDGVHVFPVRVYYEDTDAGGVVYYANYLKYAERARTEMIRTLGLDQSALAADENVLFAVRRCEVDYIRPARLDDVLEVHTRLVEAGRASLAAEQTVRRDGSEIARLLVRIACMTTDGRPTRMSERVRAALRSLSQSEQRA